jgi:histidine triad (HIT) family protein
MDCIFCKIINHEIPNYTVYENDNVLAFLDVHPCSKGHTVVIPKKHSADISELSDTEWQVLMQGVREVAKKVDEVIKPAGMNIGINNKSAAGQAVPHLHWHIIPRYENDGGGSMHSIVQSAEKIEVGDIAKLFASA